MAPNGINPDEIRRIATERGYFGGATKKERAEKIEREGKHLVQFSGASVLMVDVTPDLARRWLLNNFRNRPLRDDTVKAYARDMINGQWVATHQGLAFNDEDQLIDGQHRLHAVVIANVTVRMMVTFGLPSKIDGKEMTTMDCVDRGATRSVGDQLTIQHGFKYGSSTASICSALASLCFRERTRRLSVGQTLEVYREFEDAVMFVIQHKSKQAGLRSTGVLAGFAFAIATCKPVEGIEQTWPAIMFQNVNTGENLKDGSPMKALRAFLTSEESKLFTRSLDRGLAELVLQAIWLESNGQMIEKLELALDGAEHFRSLQQERVEKIAALFKLPKVSANAETLKTETLKVQDVSVSACQSFPSSPAPEKKERPPVEKIFLHVEHISKVSKFIITGRGSDTDINFARQLFTCAARSLGYTSEFVAYQLKKSVPQVEEWNVPSDAMPKKLKDAVEAVKSKLS